MRNFAVLTKALLKNSLSLGKKKAKTLALGALIIVSILPLLWILYTSSVDMFASRFDLMWLEMFLVATAMLVLWTALFTFASSFYFSNDVPKLLVLPVPSWTIVAAKFVINYISCLTISLIALLPLLVAFIQTHPTQIVGIVMFVLQLFLNILPPLFVMSVLTMLVMRFMPFFANKDRFNLVLGLLGIVFGVSVGVMSNMVSASDGEVVMNLMTQSPVLLGMATKLFFHVPSAAQSIVDGSFVSLLVNVAIIVALGALFFVCAQKLYLPTVLSMSQGAQKKGKRKTIRKQGALASYMSVELKQLVRTPAYLSNCVLGAFIMPIVLVLVFVINPQIRELLPMAKALPLADMFNLWIFMFLLGAGSGFFFGSVNGISGTAFSRQGRNLDFVKYIPLAMEKQILAKMGIGIAFSLLGTIIIVILAHFIFTYPVYYDLMFVLGALLSTVLINQIAILIDGLHPKLNWEDETQAVKNNMNVMAELFVSWLVLALFVGLFFLIDNLTVYTIVAGLVLVGLIVVFGIITQKLVIKHLMKI